MSRALGRVAWVACLGALAAGPAWAQSKMAGPDAPVAGGAPAEVPRGDTQLAASITVKVANREEASATLIAAAEAQGGYFSSLDRQGVRFRVPNTACDALLAQAAELGRVVDRSYASTDHT